VRSWIAPGPLTPGLLAALFALALYLPLWSPLATWAHYGEDGPELEAAGRTLGVPHPTGYPLLMLLVRTAGLAVPLPWSALNVLTLLAAVAAVFAAAQAGRSLAARAGLGPGHAVGAAGFLAGAFLAASLTLSKQALIGEVYTLHLAIVATVLALLFRGGLRAGLLAAYLLGLGLAHHLQTLPFLGVAIAYVIMKALARRERPRLAPAALAAMLAAIPITLYLTLLIRSRFNPPFDWGDPETWSRLWWTMSGAPFRWHLLRAGMQPFWDRLRDALLAGPLTQLGVGGFAFAAAGFILLLRRSACEAVTLVLLFVGTSAVAAAYAIPDPAAYYLPAVLALALAAGVGAAAFVAIAASAARRGVLAPVPRAAAAALVGAALASLAVTSQREARAGSGDPAFDYAREGVASLAPGALVVSRGDGRTFSLWYGAHVLSPREDVAILYDNLLDWPWYRRYLRRHYPDVAVPPRGLRTSLLRAWLIEGNRTRRPVYVTELEPELAAMFEFEPVGPLYRITGKSRAN
jgi:hypothetical protein